MGSISRTTSLERCARFFPNRPTSDPVAEFRYNVSAGGRRGRWAPSSAWSRRRARIASAERVRVQYQQQPRGELVFQQAHRSAEVEAHRKQFAAAWRTHSPNGCSSTLYEAFRQRTEVTTEQHHSGSRDFLQGTFAYRTDGQMRAVTCCSLRADPGSGCRREVFRMCPPLRT